MLGIENRRSTFTFSHKIAVGCNYDKRNSLIQFLQPLNISQKKKGEQLREKIWEVIYNFITSSSLKNQPSE
jgi:hypothetical protein